MDSHSLFKNQKNQENRERRPNRPLLAPTEFPVEGANTRRILTALTRRRIRTAQYTGDPGYLREALDAYLVNDADFDNSSIVQAIRVAEANLTQEDRGAVMQAGWLNHPDTLARDDDGETTFICSLEIIFELRDMNWDLVNLLLVTIVHVAFQAFEAERLDLMSNYVRLGWRFFETMNINAWVGALESGWNELVDHPSNESNLALEPTTASCIESSSPTDTAYQTSRRPLDLETEQESRRRECIDSVGDSAAGPSGLQQRTPEDRSPSPRGFKVPRGGKRKFIPKAGDPGARQSNYSGPSNFKMPKGTRRRLMLESDGSVAGPSGLQNSVADTYTPEDRVFQSSPERLASLAARRVPHYRVRESTLPSGSLQQPGAARGMVNETETPSEKRNPPPAQRYRKYGRPVIDRDALERVKKRLDFGDEPVDADDRQKLDLGSISPVRPAPLAARAGAPLPVAVVAPVPRAPAAAPRAPAAAPAAALAAAPAPIPNAPAAGVQDLPNEDVPTTPEGRRPVPAGPERTTRGRNRRRDLQRPYSSRPTADQGAVSPDL